MQTSAAAPKIKSGHGLPKTLKSIPVEILNLQRAVPEPRVLGIVVDADDKPGRRWHDIREKLTAVGVNAPLRPALDGTIIDAHGLFPRIGVWIMPDNTNSGELESLALSMISADDPVLPRARRYIEDIPAEARKFSKQKTERAVLHAWLATRSMPARMGLAVSEEDLDTASPLCQKFASWLLRLFDPQAAGTP